MESVRDIVVASHLIGDMSGPTIDDPLSDCYKRLGCDISAVDKNSEDYKMIVKYLEKTYEPIEVGEIVRILFSCFILIYLSSHLVLLILLLI